MSEQQSSLFRKESLERIQSPEQLTDYIKVTNPGIWIILFAIIILLAGVFVWSTVGKLETLAGGNAVVKDGTAQIVVTDYDKGVTNFEAVQNDRFGEGWVILEGKKAGTAVDPGHKLEFANGTHYYNEERGLHLFPSFYIYDSELKPNHLDKKGNVVASRAKADGHPFVVDYNDKVREIGIIDMAFPDIHGQERRLSDLKDNVVLLDFTAYSLPDSQQRNIDLRTLYQKYHALGLEIYQVSVDADEHYWKTMCEKLPWVCVYCAEGPGADMLQLYQVTQLPSYFLIARGSNLEARGENITDLDAAINALLK